jgi:hypothetical protein
MPPRLLWLLITAGLLTALWDRLSPHPGPALVMALVPLGLALVLVLLNLDGTPPRDSAGDLARLVELKERIVHRPRTHRVRESSARTGRRTPSADVKPVTPSAAPAGTVLDQLVRRKRGGAWSPPLPDRPDAGPAPAESST